MNKHWPHNSKHRQKNKLSQFKLQGWKFSHMRWNRKKVYIRVVNDKVK